jgi:hypothetical protein
VSAGRYKNPDSGDGRLQVDEKLGDVGSELLPILPLDRLHLIFEPQLQLLKPNFFQLLVFTEVTLLGEGIKAGGILHMLLSQLAEFLMAAQKRVSRSHHSADLQPGFTALRYLKVPQHQNRFNAEFWCSLQIMSTQLKL